MKKIGALIGLMRPGNSLMAAIGILIGFLYSGKALNIELLLLVIAGMTALGFGNVINDIVDIKSDAIAHPERALITGIVSKTEAIFFMILLVAVSLAAGYMVSPIVGHATLIPIAVLTLYSLLLKGTPLTGNITVSSLIAYTLIYGALGGSMKPLLFPALLAALSNFSREIIKDIDDKEGDLQAGLKTSAILPQRVLDFLVYSSGLLALILAYMPIITEVMNLSYGIVITAAVLPLGLFWLYQYHKKNYTLCAKLLKFEMLAGMCAILCDRFIA